MPNGIKQAIAAFTFAKVQEQASVPGHPESTMEVASPASSRELTLRVREHPGLPPRYFVVSVRELI